MKKEIIDLLNESSLTIASLKSDCAEEITAIVKALVKVYRRKGKVLIFGNGGSAADSQHIAAELVGRFKKERRALPAVALTTNTSNLTALANDYSYDYVFERQLDALGTKNDVAIGISTSGQAKNVISALKKARQKGMFCIALTGSRGLNLKKITDICLIVPSKNTPRIQEAHITAAHIICELVENALSDE